MSTSISYPRSTYTTRYDDFGGYYNSKTNMPIRRSTSTRIERNLYSNFGSSSQNLYGNSMSKNNERLYRSTSCERELNIDRSYTGRSNATSIYGYTSIRYPLTKFGSSSDTTSSCRPLPLRTFTKSFDRQPISKTDSDIDYRKLYEMEKQKSSQLRDHLLELEATAAEMTENMNNVRAIGSPIENAEYLTNKLRALELQNKELQGEQEENLKLTQENVSLLRVISKLSKSG